MAMNQTPIYITTASPSFDNIIDKLVKHGENKRALPEATFLVYKGKRYYLSEYNLPNGVDPTGTPVKQEARTPPTKTAHAKANAAKVTPAPTPVTTTKDDAVLAALAKLTEGQAALSATIQALDQRMDALEDSEDDSAI